MWHMFATVYLIGLHVAYMCVTVYLIGFTGGHVHMVCRNQERAETAQQEIMNISGNTVSSLLRFSHLPPIPPASQCVCEPKTEDLRGPGARRY